MAGDKTTPGEGLGRFQIRAEGDQVDVFIKPPDDHPIYAKIGKVASDWSHFEHVLDEIIWVLSGVTANNLGCVTGQMMGHAPRTNAIIALLTARAAPKAIVKRVENLRDKAYSASEKRNRVVHDCWYLSISRPEDAFAQFRSMPPKDLRFGLTDVADDTFLKTTLAEIRRCYDNAVRLFEETFQE